MPLANICSAECDSKSKYASILNSSGVAAVTIRLIVEKIRNSNETSNFVEQIFLTGCSIYAFILCYFTTKKFLQILC